MFAGSYKGAVYTALYMQGTCKQNIVEPFTLVKKLKHLSYHSIQRFEELPKKNIIVPAEKNGYS